MGSTTTSTMLVLGLFSCSVGQVAVLYVGVSIWADLWPLLWSCAAMNTDHVDHEH